MNKKPNQAQIDAMYKRRTRADVLRAAKARRERQVLATTSLIHLIGKKEIA